MNRTRLVIKYLLLDFLTAALAWGAFFVYRKAYVDGVLNTYHLQFVRNDPNLYIGLALIPAFWIGLYTIIGLYRSVYRKSRLREFIQLFVISAIGVIILFFTLLIDDEVANYANFYFNVGILFTLHFIPTSIARFLLSTNVAHKIKGRKIGFKTLIIGSGTKAKKMYQELSAAKKSEGHFFQGFVNINGEKPELTEIPHLGSRQNLDAIIEEHEIEEVIIATEEHQKSNVADIISALSNKKLVIKIIPDLYQHLTGMVKMGNVFGAVLIDIQTNVLPPWEKFLKRMFDIGFASTVLILGLPIYMILAICVKIDSKGPVFFRQERVGLYGKPFQIIKFRSMKQNAEVNGPQLAQEDDPRVTKLGKFLRKVRLDEFPQFWNVLMGDMSVVGPRPERQYFIEQIIKKAPHYVRMQKVKPGITSWGQVKYGYAENVDEMVERLQYDLLYLENISLLLDLKILIYTVLIMVQGRGK